MGSNDGLGGRLVLQCCMDHIRGSSLKAWQKVLSVMVIEAWEVDPVGSLLVERAEEKG